MSPTRREVCAAIGGSALAAAAAATAAADVQPPAPRMRARTRPVVLVHGAWHGGWCWRPVIERLRASDARVFAPTLTGLGERAHLRSPVPTLGTHVADVLGVIEAEELTDVVLVGHSYAGMVITGVCDRVRHRIAHAIYLDAAIPDDGQSMLTQMPGITAAEADAARAQLTTLAGGGDWLPPFSAELLGVPATQPELRAWLDRRMTPHPLPAWFEPLVLRNGGSTGLPRTYVACTAPPLAGASMPLHAERVRSGRAGEGWRYVEIATGHEAMVTEPERVAAIVMAAVAAVATA